MSLSNTATITWFFACKVEDVPANGGVCVKYRDEQIALFHFSRRGEWYATQNLCPHRRQMALSRGMIGTQGGEPKVACPFHKKSFSLADGRCLSDDTECSLTTYPVKVEEDRVYIGIVNGSGHAAVMA
ncbi:nitrite reductase small subunit NirD [Chitinophaga japonensis]|uniref:Nitrite reductase (NADH) small subunit n=1 Tax=Chitinophaga japonensis TaxID=104662 RepID=A0A562STK1_CHIJA|nr:nitrite reductase small subunit NirD [Chitinophaga japonensis]TWI84080.1 nitrite reductase (NADH) small subunit [Chitinophaga japonensis]